MTFYRYGDLILESDMSLELPRDSDETGCGFRVRHARGPGAVSCQWVQRYCLPDGEPWLSVAKHEGGYLLRFHGLADFQACASRREILCRPESDTDLETVKHLLLDQVMPRVLSLTGKLVLHGSAVVTSAGAIVFIGETGWGKSTLAASFGRQGYPVLADDCLLVEERDGRLVGVPSYAGLRLWPGTIAALFGEELSVHRVAKYTEKMLARLDNGRVSFCSDPVPLQRVYSLATPQQGGDTKVITIEALPGRAVFVELIKSVFRLDVTDQRRLREEFERLGQWATSLDVRRLGFPREFSFLPAVHDAVLSNLSE